MEEDLFFSSFIWTEENAEIVGMRSTLFEKTLFYFLFSITQTWNGLEAMKHPWAWIYIYFLKNYFFVK